MPRWWLVAVLLAALASRLGAATSFVQPLADGRSTEGWGFMRDAARLEAEYVTNQLTAAGGTYDWQFEPRTVQYADIFLSKPVEAPFDALAVEVRNVGEPLELVSRVADEGWAEYVSPRTRLAAGEGWRSLTWPRSSFQVGFWSKDANRRLDFPLTMVSLTVYEVSAGHRYHLQFRNLRLIRTVGSRVRLTSGRLPAVWQVGKAERLRLTLASDDWRALTDGGLAVDLYQDGKPVYSRWLGELELPGARVEEPLTPTLSPRERGKNRPVRLTVDRQATLASPYWRPGRYQAAIRLGGALAAVQEVDVKTAPAGLHRPPEVEVKPYQGAPTLFINGRPDAAMVYMTYRPLAKHFGQFGQAGVHLYSFSSTPSQAGYGLAPACWTGPDSYDYSAIDQRAAQILDADPAGYFFPRLYLLSPAWWDEQHPDDLVTYDPGDGKPVPFWHQPGKRAPSWASEAWRRDTADALRRYIRHIEASPYADRVIGYHLASGTTEEWMQWGSNDDQWVDYSPANLAKFRSWLRDKYGTDARLQAAWADPAATLATAAIPTRAERAGSELGLLRDPAKAQRCIDYTLYNSWLVADTMAYLARVVKGETHRQRLVGVFYGYVLQLAGEQREQNAGHLALEQVLSNPDIDFVTSPSSYAFRQLGTGFSHFMSLLDSVKLHGKMWFDENDIRTWLTREGTVGDQVGKTGTFEETLLHQRRELANVLCNACGMWWFDMSGGWYDDPRIMGEIASLRAVADSAVKLDRSPVAEIAVVVDDKSSAYMKTSNGLSHDLLVRQLPELGRVGAPFAYVHLADLERAPRYRMYVFPNCLAPTAGELAAIERVVKREGRLAVWLWAAGILGEGRLDPAGMARLTGIDLRLAAQTRPLQVQVTGDEAWVGAAAGTTYGPAAPFGPVVTVEDAKAVTLGLLSGTSQVGLAAKDMGGWTSVFSAAPTLPHALLRALAARAGVHLYAPAGDVVYASAGLLGVTVNQGGPRTVTLPRPAAVWDLYGNRQVAERADHFTADVPAAGTGLWRIDY